MLIIPAIDLRGGLCVRLRQGQKHEATVYDGDPVEIALSYQSDGARMVHIVDLDGAFADPNSLNRQVLARIVSRIRIPVQFGGGLRTLEDIEKVFELGVTRVVVGTLAVESPETLTRALLAFGGACVVVGIDARGGQVMTRGWEKEESISAADFAHIVATYGVERIVYTDVARDGMLTGVNIEQTCAIARASGLKVTASGGIASLEDIWRLKSVSECGIDSVIVGRALYEGRFTLKEAVVASESL
jgi:phosphoribosylformimino-5-aminoimidazole carboxamide ribotide isomerase